MSIFFLLQIKTLLHHSLERLQRLAIGFENAELYLTLNELSMNYNTRNRTKNAFNRTIAGLKNVLCEIEFGIISIGQQANHIERSVMPIDFRHYDNDEIVKHREYILLREYHNQMDYLSQVLKVIDERLESDIANQSQNNGH